MSPNAGKYVKCVDVLQRLGLALAGSALLVPAAWSASITLNVPGCATNLNAVVEGGVVTLNCSSTPPPPEGAPVCNATATPSSGVLVGGGTVELKVSCDKPLVAGAKQWKWSGGAEITTAQSSPYLATANVTANPGSNARDLNFEFFGACAEADPTKCAVVKVSSRQNGTTPPPPPPGGLPTSCNDNGATLKVVKFDGAQSDGSLAFSSLNKFSAMFNGKAEMAMGVIRTRSTVSNNTGSMRFTDNAGTGSVRKVVISETACDLVEPYPYSRGPAVDFSMLLSVGGSGDYIAHLKPNTTYFVHLLYRTSTGVACASGSCGTLMELKAPAGH